MVSHKGKKSPKISVLVPVCNVEKYLPECLESILNQTIKNMISDGVDTFIEVGAGKVLSGLIKKISKDVKVFHVENEADLREVTAYVKG